MEITICCYYISKHMAREALQNHCINRARLTACEVGILSREISQLLKIFPPHSLKSSLSSLPMGVFLKIMVGASTPFTPGQFLRILSEFWLVMGSNGYPLSRPQMTGEKRCHTLCVWD